MPALSAVGGRGMSVQIEYGAAEVFCKTRDDIERSITEAKSSQWNSAAPRSEVLSLTNIGHHVVVGCLEPRSLRRRLPDRFLRLPIRSACAWPVISLTFQPTAAVRDAVYGALQLQRRSRST